MKKIFLSLAVAIGLTLGLASCSGDLHDDYIKPWYIEGAITSGRVAMTTNNETGHMSYAFTYNSETMNGWESSKGNVHFKVMISATGWDDDFGFGGESVAINAKDDEGNDKWTSLIPRGSDDPQHIVISGLTDGEEYTIFINGDAVKKTASILVKGADAVVYPDLYIVSQKLDKMTLEDGVYKCTKTLPAGDYTFSIFDGTSSYGVKTDRVDLDTEIELISTDDAKPITITIENPGDYLICGIINDDGIVTLNIKSPNLAEKNGVVKLDSGLISKSPLVWNKDGEDDVSIIELSGEIDNAWWLPGKEGDSLADNAFRFWLGGNTWSAEEGYHDSTVTVVCNGGSVDLTNTRGKTGNTGISGVKAKFGSGLKEAGKPDKIVLDSPVTIIIRSTKAAITMEIKQ